jgi:ribosomal protein S18 acetylase RimI-like enzyme
VHIEQASLEDAEEILAVIRAAFTPVAAQYGDPSLPPVAESLQSHRARYADHVVLKAVDGGRIIGSGQGVDGPGGVCVVERLVVLPEWQGRGIGRALTRAIEASFPHAAAFELFTGHRSTETLGLYRSLGYAETRRDYVDERLTLVYLRKEASRP